ncbi:nuclear transport factor 2 family protein [Maridesulfovibrio sp.]|uniref:nuclear transport factor 2 family protein n=1 Tax=Maridesulfovibrio sp. TaxID=2795000 RepID=UPI002A18C125|nr:nuclear transport factor 2 family protein [Maridesulfovibrio sp.]
MKKILLSMLMLMVVFCAAVSAGASAEDGVRDQIKDVLFDYKDSYNIRDFAAIRALYADNAVVMSFPCKSTEELMFADFSESLPRCSSYWLDSSFKLRLFKITSFEVNGNTCNVRVQWDYRSNDGRGKFNPSFELLRKDGKWLIVKELYGRKGE